MRCNPEVEWNSEPVAVKCGSIGTFVIVFVIFNLCWKNLLTKFKHRICWHTYCNCTTNLTTLAWERITYTLCNQRKCQNFVFFLCVFIMSLYNNHRSAKWWKEKLTVPNTSLTSTDANSHEREGKLKKKGQNPNVNHSRNHQSCRKDWNINT